VAPNRMSSLAWELLDTVGSRRTLPARRLPRSRRCRPIRSSTRSPITPALDQAVQLILKAERPLVMLGTAASRPRLADACPNSFAGYRSNSSIQRWERGSVAGGFGLYMGTAALSKRDYVHHAIDGADLIIAIGDDTVVRPPFIMRPRGPTVLHIGHLPATVEEVFFPHAELVGDVGPSLRLLADRLEGSGRGRCSSCARRSWRG
jgi:acetolactate synthase I/II/III large subunit